MKILSFINDEFIKGDLLKDYIFNLNYLQKYIIKIINVRLTPSSVKDNVKYQSYNIDEH